MNLGIGRGISKASQANWTSVIQGCRCGIFIHQTPQEPEIVIVPPTDRIVHTDRIQTYEEMPAPVRPRHLVANWTSITLGNNPNRPTTDKIIWGQPQWNMFNDDNRQGQRHNRPSDDMESMEGDPIYSDEDGSTSEPGLEDVE